ncbi:MAG: hypothetical protein KAJ03_11640 [Gammaproteobacteria bacterium]|nr:hypothetical protein [Gammaproteobacteria bacterium]
MVLHEYATHKKELIHIKSVSDKDRSNVYICPDCGETLSFKLHRTRNASHFAHKSDGLCSGGSGGEGELHNSFKNAMFYMLNEAHQSDAPFYTTKICRCSESVKVDLLDDCTEIKMEKYIAAGYCPDITIKGAERDTVIEVVVTHRPDPHCYEYINENNVRAVIVEINEDAKKSLDDKNELTQSKEKNIEILNCDEWNTCESCIEWARTIKENTIRRAKEAELARIKDERIRKIREQQIEATRIAREARLLEEKIAVDEQRKQDDIERNVTVEKNRIIREERNRQNALHDEEKLAEYEQHERENNKRIALLHEKKTNERIKRLAHCESSTLLKGNTEKHMSHSKKMLATIPPDECTKWHTYCIECAQVLICEMVKIPNEMRDNIMKKNSLYYTK